MDQLFILLTFRSFVLQFWFTVLWPKFPCLEWRTSKYVPLYILIGPMYINIEAHTQGTWYQTRATSTLRTPAHAPHIVRQSWQNFCQNCLMRAHTYVCMYICSMYTYDTIILYSVTLTYVHRMSQSEKETVGCVLLHMWQYLWDMNVHYDYIHWT